jgi:Flp pilus assembly protein TadB
MKQYLIIVAAILTAAAIIAFATTWQNTGREARKLKAEHEMHETEHLEVMLRIHQEREAFRLTADPYVEGELAKAEQSGRIVNMNGVLIPMKPTKHDQ